MNSTIIEQLLAIESEAQEAMKDIEKENLRLNETMQENLSKRISAIENEGAEKIKRLVSEAENHTAERIAQIQEEYLIKAEGFENEFRIKEKAQRAKIFHDVLYKP